MFDGIRVIILSFIVTAAVGAIFGLLVGIVIDQVLITVGLGAFLGANFGVVLGYGFLPEAPADERVEAEAEAKPA